MPPRLGVVPQSFNLMLGRWLHLLLPLNGRSKVVLGTVLPLLRVPLAVEAKTGHKANKIATIAVKTSMKLTPKKK